MTSDFQGRSRPRTRTQFFSSQETGADAHPRLRKEDMGVGFTHHGRNGAQQTTNT